MPTLNWIGKDKVLNHHLEVPFHVLERQYSFDEAGKHEEDNGSENMIIHGDNLLALKSLLPKYEGKIKCIYIDPPYNTGNENWVYNDNVNDPHIQRWLHQVVGKEGEDLSRHDKWLCMMYPRLKLLQRLLADDGVIFISIDVFEYAHLKCIMDEIFGIANFRNCIAVRRGIKNVQAQFEEVQALSLGHEYIYLYSKNTQAKLPKLSKPLELAKAGKWDTFWRGTDRPTMRYRIFDALPTSGQWRWEENRTRKAMKNYDIYISKYADKISLDDFFIEHLMATNEKLDFVRKNENGVIQYYVPPQTGKLLSDNWMDILLSGSFAGFDTEKNVLLIQRIIDWIVRPGEIVLDSFAGSGTTAHAVLNMNKADGGNRKFICIEMMDYADTITAERVKRVINGYGEGKKTVDGTGGSFSYYELGEPLLVDDKLNNAVSTEKIREYIYYMETKQALPEASADEPMLLGVYHGAAYYFNYEKDASTTLNAAFLKSIKTQAEAYVIYADTCVLSENKLQQFHITFKKIPRDIARL
ncbi:MAG: site-specific DNA-methyltransferase [Phascolarctobacterium succinatutens]|uniref:site-specific DNA-methyltransferase n=1 Tax=Phascolarctobacterium succinatutens TaxID=626940 RepID=UPI002E780A19|nr:site-specific DNA-methyltransferase [Phascolarctobacterium succinatutens]MEE0357458.1 site-specific DNA-methyltransferase [Phascolarctobacterium succinatutens]